MPPLQSSRKSGPEGPKISAAGEEYLSMLSQAFSEEPLVVPPASNMNLLLDDDLDGNDFDGQ
jgi:hypothetical protein